MSFIEINNDFNFVFESLQIFILIVLISWLILVIYSLKIYRVKKTIRYFLPIIIASLIGELIGVADGRYNYPGYLLYISALGGSVPVIIAIGWSVNLFLLLHMGKYIVQNTYQNENLRQIFYISVCAGFFGLCFDLLEDPIAHHNGWWIWNQPFHKITLAGVPLTNFGGWIFIISSMTFLTLLIDKSHFSENRKLVINITIPLIVFLLGGIYFLFF